MKRHLGFTTFTITLMLIVILLGISLLAGKLMVADRRVSLNEVQYRQALALAELGLSDGVGRLTQDAAWRTPSSGISITVSAGNYTLQAQDEPAVVVGGANVVPVRVRAMASLVDSTANAEVEIKAIKISVLAGTPAAPLTIAGGMAVSGNFTVVANPNGGGPGVPLSVWTNGNVDLTNGSGQTCHQGDYSGGCSAYISQKGDKQSDIKDNDTAFPTDLVWYLFNENDDATGWANLESRAVQLLKNCDSLSTASSGLIIVDGDCKPGGSIGSTSAPVVLIVRNGNLTVNGSATLYGLVFAYSSTPATTTTDISLKGGAIVNGAVVANYQLGKTANGTFDAKYDQAVLSNIENGAAFQSINLVPGSWRDW
ncbi:hypothetical protein I6L35_09245 [Aeromonas sp. FDAARGOS 1405]|uniref:pilus assembly PilX N-terminal domain-containing protein n=1 Tax=unclassified Aeromonas TaxID=257493 RepID=UPI001C21B6AE|nr:pilus assembly PilX N-terminal domain-containing protein [Aeromonas sp. FDAARGOS 1405]QXB31296.1 hypothetical protein I6L35_09245 [Aeromonas sp. FDAARGOS 1405]